MTTELHDGSDPLRSLIRRQDAADIAGIDLSELNSAGWKTLINEARAYIDEAKEPDQLLSALTNTTLAFRQLSLAITLATSFGADEDSLFSDEVEALEDLSARMNELIEEVEDYFQINRGYDEHGVTIPWKPSRTIAEHVLLVADRITDYRRELDSAITDRKRGRLRTSTEMLDDDSGIDLEVLY